MQCWWVVRHVMHSPVVVDAFSPIKWTRIKRACLHSPQIWVWGPGCRHISKSAWYQSVQLQLQNKPHVHRLQQKPRYWRNADFLDSPSFSLQHTSTTNMSYIIYMTRLFNETILHTVYCDSSPSLSRSTTKTLDEFPEAFDKLTVGTNGQRYGAHGSAASRTRTEHVTTHMPPPRGPKSDAQCNWCVGSGTCNTVVTCNRK